MALPKTFSSGERLFASDLNSNFEDLDTRLGTIDLEDLANVSGSPTVGDTLVYDGSEWVSGPRSGNAIINGDFGVWQRGTSFSGLTATTYTADRWQAVKGGATSADVTREAFTPSDIEAIGYGDAEFFVRWDVTGTGNVNTMIRQRIEDVRTFANQTVTLSFWARAASTFNLQTVLTQAFGVGGSSSVDLDFPEVAITTSWQRFSISVYLGSVSGKTIGSGSTLDVRFTDDNGDSPTLDLWGVQLEAGPVATPFRLAGGGSKAAELALCQRYYLDTAIINASISAGFFPTTTLSRITVALPFPMRITPSVSGFTDIKSGGSSFASTFDGAGMSPSGTHLFIRNTVSGATANEVCVEVDGGQLDAEL